MWLSSRVSLLPDRHNLLRVGCTKLTTACTAWLDRPVQPRLSSTSRVQLLRILEMPRVDSPCTCPMCNTVREGLREMAVQAESVREHISRARFFSMVQWDSKFSMQSGDMLTMLRSRNRSLLDSMVVVGKVGRPEVQLEKMSGCTVALASLSTPHPLDMTCPTTPEGTVDRPRSSLLHRDSSVDSLYHLLHTEPGKHRLFYMR